MSTLVKQITLCAFGTMFEWYDFSLFAALAPFISEIFFSQDSQFYAMMLTFVVFASGFIMRPIGAIFFGHLGDRIGRKSTLLITVLIMTISPVAIGLIPTGFGSLSVLLLVFFRLSQGFAASGEYPGSITLLSEQSNIRRKNFIASFGIFAAPAGIFMGTLVCVITSSLIGHEEMLLWGFRIPFLIAAPIGIIGYLVRKSLLESLDFKRAKKENILVKFPLIHLVKEFHTEFIVLFCLYILSSVSFYINLIYISNYSISTNKFGSMSALYLNLIITMVYAIAILLFGLLSDYFGSKRLMIMACLLMILSIYPLFLIILNASVSMQFLAQSVISIMIGMFVGPLAAFSTDLFPTQIRYTGVSMSLNFSAAIFGGTTPLVCVWLTKFAYSPIAPAYYFMFVATLALGAIIYIKFKVKSNSYLKITNSVQVSPFQR